MFGDAVRDLLDPRLRGGGGRLEADAGRVAAEAGHLIVFDRAPDRPWADKIFRRALREPDESHARAQESGSVCPPAYPSSVVNPCSSKCLSNANTCRRPRLRIASKLTQSTRERFLRSAASNAAIPCMCCPDETQSIVRMGNYVVVESPYSRHPDSVLQ